jgi:hypothetical protein
MRKTPFILALVFFCGPSAFAQTGVAGQVIDPSGAPIPDVAVEAESDASRFRTSTTSTDAEGRYRLSLESGLYRLRFTRTGWKTHQVTDVEAPVGRTITIDAQLQVGPLSDTTSISAEPPVIDLRSATRAVSLTGNLIRSLPTARSYNALLVLVPGIVTNSNDTVTGPAATAFPIHGGRQNESRLFLDGFNIGSPPSGNSATIYDVDLGQAQEVSFTLSGGLGEVETAGLVMNVIPKSGGNVFSGSLFASGTGAGLQSDNLTPELLAQNVSPASPFTKTYDIAATAGGAIVRDRLWYFVAAHSGGSTRKSTNVYYNLNAGDPVRWRYVPDVNRVAYSDRTFESVSGRVTWQMTPRNKLTGVWDVQSMCRSCSGATPGVSEPQRVSPEAVGVLGRRLDVTQLSWSSSLHDRVLLEAGYGGTAFGVGNFEREPNPTRDLIRIVEQCASGCAANGDIPGLVYRSQDFSVAHAGSYMWRGSVSYLSGTRTLKAGYQRTLMVDDRTWLTNNQALTYRVDNGTPTQLTQSISPWINDARAGWDAVFVQGDWTLRQLTLQGAVRFDRARSWFPEQQEGPSRFLPTPIVIAETRGIDSYHDITPRVGVAYDVGGNGRTVIKLHVGQYLEPVGVSGIYASTNPTLRMPQTTSTFGTAGVTRSWTDANANFVPDCDLHNPAAQDLRGSGGDSCGVLSNVNFGSSVLSNSFDPNILSGWGVRPSDWNIAVSAQQQIGRRSSLDITYIHRTFRGFTVADNLSLQPADLTPFSVVAPLDRRLPGGGGYTIGGLYDVVPAKAGQVDNFITDSGAYGEWYQHFHGVDVTAMARVGGLTIAGGTSTGQTVADNCEARAALPELATTTTGTSAFGAGLMTSAVTPVSPYCHVAFGVLTQVRGLASYTVPRIDVELSTGFQSKPGALLAANYAVPNAAVVPSLGRSLSADARTVTVNLIPPGSLYGDRVNQVDVRVGKTFAARRLRTTVGVDVYNLLNSSAVLTYNNAFVPGGTWLQPMTVLTPRLFKVTGALDW